ncbi:TIGR00266 family protein [Pyrococcus kukulkanii]|uniref:TIGR00266 family protein n=1 Tax=Pyrococcus kukulkanii TaxID=1609559 RepID=UPI003569F948
MKYKIEHRPSFSLLEIQLGPGEAVQAEAGAMVYMDPTVSLETKARGGIFGALKRSILGGESFFVNVFRGPGKVGFAPGYPGDIIELEVDGKLYAQSGAFIAASEDIDIDVKFGGATTFIGREGVFLLEMRGRGVVFLSSYGAIQKISLNGESLIVDTGHMVAFTEGIDFTIKRMGGLKSTLFSGEGLVFEFRGTGDVYIQTRSLDGFLNWLLPHLQKS